MKKILILANNDMGLYKFRKELVEELLNNYEVFISLPDGNFVKEFTELGCKFIKTNIDRRGTNPIKDIKLFSLYIKIIKKIKPDIVLTYTIKPNVYGGMASRITNTPYLPNVTGLGTALENEGVIQKITLKLYKIALGKAACVFFQNNLNRQVLLDKGVLKSKSKVIPGSGVNVIQHKFKDYPPSKGNVKILFIGRLMREKGVEELIKAIKIVKPKYPTVEFHFVGGREETNNPIIEDSIKDNLIIYHGVKSQVHEYIKNSHALINPSHHEGMSNVLLEAASTGRPVLASIIPGCKETFDEGRSGFGFEVKSVTSIAETIVKFIELPYEKKIEMGMTGRKKIENEFDRNIVINSYLEEIQKAIGGIE